MAYNNYFPSGYQPAQFYYPQQGQSQQTPQSNNSIIWVQGEAGAKSYLVAPNTTVQLWDSESNTIYIKSADASGMPSMRIIDYTFRDNAPNVAQKSNDFVTHDELTELKNYIDGRINSMIGGSHDNEQRTTDC